MMTLSVLYDAFSTLELCMQSRSVPALMCSAIKRRMEAPGYRMSSPDVPEEQCVTLMLTVETSGNFDICVEGSQFSVCHDGAQFKP